MLLQVNVGFFNALKLWPETWVANTAYALGDVVKPTAYTSSSPAEGSRHSYKCTTAGTSHATTEPTWGTTNSGTTADNTVVWTCYDPKTYAIKAPQGSTVPYCTFGLLTDVPMGTFVSPTKMENLTYWVNAFSDKSTADVSEIADEIMTALDNATLSVTGYNPMKCVREFISGTRWDMETNIYQTSLRYRIWVDKA